MGCQVSGAMYLYHSVPFQCSAVLYCIMGHYKVVRTALPVAIHKTITKILDEILGQFWLYKMHGIEQNRIGSKFTFTAHVFHAGFVCNSCWLQAEFWFIDTKRIVFPVTVWPIQPSYLSNSCSLAVYSYWQVVYSYHTLHSIQVQSFWV